jgi:hypothetical protein
MRTLLDAISVYRLYRRTGNGPKHAAVAAWHIAVQKLPF